jgi:hypothetical protein
MIDFTPDEAQLIAQLSVPGGWDAKEAAALKKKIKDHFLANPVPCCCYCRLSMSPWHKITIDTEHVLPKQQFSRYTFDVRNLNISCKRCNMEIKGTDITFYVGLADEANPFRSELYLFVHPNLDKLDDHLQIISVQIGAKLLISYFPQTPKGQFTFEYFELNEIQTNSFNSGQGVTLETPSDNFPQEISKALRAVLKSIERE